MRTLLLCLFPFVAIFSHSFLLNAQTDPNQPNVLLIIADDLGVDAVNGYLQSNVMPTTPVLDSLRQQGLTFKNVWSSPNCTPTRAGIMSGKYGVKTGITKAPGNLDPVHTSLFSALSTQTGNAYSKALLGKYHISSPVDHSHPGQLGIDYYDCVFNSGVDDYYNWEGVKNGQAYSTTEYVTSYYTDEAIDWINNQNQSWLLWLAHLAPHSPFQTPPAGLYTQGPTNNQKQRFMAMIEAMDHEMGRLFANIPAAVLANTVILFVGDNGSPQGVGQSYPSGHYKQTVYQGGVQVPLIVSGAGVSRLGEEETAIVNTVDIHASILELTGASLQGGVHNSYSFAPLLANAGAVEKPYSYTEREGDLGMEWAIRDAQYKLIQFGDGREEFYDLIADPFETNDLMGALTAAQQGIRDDMKVEAFFIQSDWSCQDLIENGSESAIDVGSATCTGVLPPCGSDNSTSTTNIGCCSTPQYDNNVMEIEYDDVRMISTNNYPDHEFCYTNNAHIPEPKNYLLSMDATPQLAAEPTSILTGTYRPSIFFGLGVNGVLLAPAPATPFIFENTETGEYNWNWVFEPTMNQGQGQGRVGLDCSSAHTGPQGYHYHGNMFEFAEQLEPGITTSNNPPAQPLQIGWAADGFPILYRFGPDGQGGLALLDPSYQLKSGDRPGNGITAPCGPYNGKYTNDYEYVVGAGDLDECNGIARSVNINTVCGLQTFDYFYVITEDFPQIGRCLSGTPDLSFDNGNPQGECQPSLYSQELQLQPGQSITVGSSTYAAAGIYQDILVNAAGCDSVVVSKIEEVTAGISLDARVFLQGAYMGTATMKTDLSSLGLLPNQQPFNVAPWNYGGAESINFDPIGVVVDWVLVEIRDANNNNVIVDQQAALLSSDGSLLDVNGNSGLVFGQGFNGNAYYLSIRSRNHLPVISHVAINFPQAGTHDFSQSGAAQGGLANLHNEGDGRYSLPAGDFDANGVINFNDFNLFQAAPTSIYYYVHNDCSLDGFTTVLDFNLYKGNFDLLAPMVLRL